MYELIDDVEKMSDLEMVMLIYAALSHDFGMVVSDREIEEIYLHTYQDSNEARRAIFEYIVCVLEGQTVKL